MLRLPVSSAVGRSPARRGLRRPQRREQPCLRLRRVGQQQTLLALAHYRLRWSGRPGPDHRPPRPRRTRRGPRLRAVPVGAEPARHSGGAGPRAACRGARRPRRGGPPRGRRGRRPSARPVRHGVLPRREPRQRASVRPRTRRRRRESRPRFRPSRPAGAPALPRHADRVLAGQLCDRRPCALHGRRPRRERDPRRDARAPTEGWFPDGCYPCGCSAVRRAGSTGRATS